ncbi:hypothetical protein TNCV_3473771 [Trichonephila clavipes]|nr:hypothetical protein TNCV_3473771 [Trichonephila clavipes]
MGRDRQGRPKNKISKNELGGERSDISDISDFMDLSPTRQSKVAACEKLRDTVHSISAMHSSISEGARTPTKKNSFLELYQMTSFDLAKKKTNW